MVSLGEMLGQDQAASRIVDDLQGPDVRVVRLNGPPGSGKTQTALRVGKDWEANGGNCVIGLGDSNSSSRSLYPFLSGLSLMPLDWAALAGQGSRSAIQMADRVAGAGGAATTIFDLLTSVFRQRTQRALRPFSTLERDVILDLKRLARSSPLLLIADNAHWWDEDSLWLLAELMSDRLRSEVPHLDSIYILIVDSAPDQRPSVPERFNAITAACVGHTWALMRCTRVQFPEILRTLGLRQDLPEDVLDALYSATGGHLKLAEELVAYAERHNLSHLLTSSAQSYLGTLLSSRLASLGSVSVEMRALLDRAAVIGLSFEEQELICLAGGLYADLANLVDRAEGASLLHRGQGRLFFSHDVVRSSFLSEQAPSELRAHRKKFAACLAILRPGDYAARANVLLQAGESEGGRDMFAIAAIDRVRRGTATSRVLRDAAIQFPDDEDLGRYLELMSAGYEAVDSGLVRTPLPRLKISTPTESPLLAAERNYLVALCSIALHTTEGASEAHEILTSWLPTVHSEPELSVRFLLLLQQVQILADLFDEARETERTIEQRLLLRARYSTDAAVMLQIQNRRSSAINVPEIAEMRIREAATFFRRGTGDMARDRLELYRASNNLAAIQIRLGKDAEAYASAHQGVSVASDSPESIARLDVLASNLVLAGQRSGVLSVSEAIRRQHEIINSAEGGDDKFIHRCNLAGYLLLGGEDEEARDQLSGLSDELQGKDLGESYLIYYWSALDIAATMLVGDQVGAIERHLAMESFIQSLSWPCASYVRRRQEILDRLLPTMGPYANRTEADMSVIDAYPSEIGPAWRYYGRLIPCCELSFWSDS